MRHSRSQEFEEHLHPRRTHTARWSDLSPDPNSPVVVARRAETLRSAWRPPIADRLAFIEDRCRGRTVLDVGCVAHDVARMASPNWLHGRLAGVANRCIGVDVLTDGIREMVERGYEVVAHDLATGLGPLSESAPFDVIVAGELIEHVESLDMLFRVASEALSTTGALIITTPNPYAPHRVRAAQRGIVWENVDHIMYAFPSGIAELAERHGLVLAEAAVTDDRPRRTMVEHAKSVKRRIYGRQWVAVGYSTVGTRRVRRVHRGALGRLLTVRSSRRRLLLGETFVYVVRGQRHDQRDARPSADVGL